jgi:thiamine-monophosphate kinase
MPQQRSPKPTDKTLSEENIIELLQQLNCSAANLKPADDVAQLKSGSMAYAATDSLIEGTHYRDGWLSPADIAYKLFARNWSDFLCKNLRPRHALLNLALSRRSTTPAFLWQFLRELDRLLSAHGIALIGGDTARARTDVFTLTFLAHSGTPIWRSNTGVRAGDKIVQLGHVGGSEFARWQLGRNLSSDAKILKYFKKPQLFEKLPRASQLKASIDQSDSVRKTLQLLAQAGRLHLEINLDQILVSHGGIEGAQVILAAAEDLAIFAITDKKAKFPPATARIQPNTPAFRDIGVVKSIRVDSPGVTYFAGGKIVHSGGHEYRHFG